MTKSKIAGWLAAFVVVAVMSGNRTWSADEKPKDAPDEKPAKKRAEKTAASGKGSLSKVATLKVGVAHNIVLVDKRAYVATNSGLTILDISKIDAPKKLGEVKTPGLMNMDVVVKGKHAFLANPNVGVIVVDVSNDAAPKIVAKKAMPKCWGLALKDNVLYAINENNPGAMFIFDISNPASPKEVGKIGLPQWRPADYAHKPASREEEKKYMAQLRENKASPTKHKTGVSVTGDKLVAVDCYFGRIFLYDVSTPAKPVFKGTHFAPYVIRALISGEYLYGLAGYRSVAAIHSVKMSVLSPDKPTSYHKSPDCHSVKGPVGNDQGGLGASESGKHVFRYTGKAGHFEILSTSPSGKMTPVASETIPNHGGKLFEMYGVASRGDYIFVCGGESGVVVLRYPGL